MAGTKNDTTPAAKDRQAGKGLRESSPRTGHAGLGAQPADRNAVAIILASDAGRLPELISERHRRMLASPFTFFRGAAGVQAQDLVHTPSSGIIIQCCGDAHLMNFGGFATPERRLIFDLNDFDETLTAPFEWDVKRLAASVVLAARSRGVSDARAHDITLSALAAYRAQMATAAQIPALETWYDAISWEGVLEAVTGSGEAADLNADEASRAASKINAHVFHKLTRDVAGIPRLLDQPPFLYHPPKVDLTQIAGPFLQAYGATLRDDLGELLGRFRFIDAAIKVVGVGSVGLRNYIALMLGVHNEPLFLQIKEARDSVLCVRPGAPDWASNGARVVAGQHRLQAASDVFLGWAKGPDNRDFYVRQARDLKASVNLDSIAPKALGAYASLCGRTLARAHAKAGSGPRIAGYLGRSDAFDTAVASYALAYADQTEKDFTAFQVAQTPKTRRR